MTKLYPPLTLTASPELVVSGYQIEAPENLDYYGTRQDYDEVNRIHLASKVTVKVHKDSDTLFRHESGLLVLNLPGFYLDNLKYGIDISSLADRLEFIPLEKPGDDNGEYFIKLLPAE